jgi:divalent metal cation (Fe/Co/Zn/Cd) transporter
MEGPPFSTSQGAPGRSLVYRVFPTQIVSDSPLTTDSIGVTAVSLGVMWWLAKAKRRAAVALGSRAMEADAFQTTACWWLSLTALGGVGLNAAFGWWWADPLAALGMTFFL